MAEQPVFLLGEGLSALEPAAFDTEVEFQALLARHPRILDFGSLADGRPLRLFLVAREMRVPTGSESGAAYWLDHLFVDADGVPTLVEVKRAADTRVRREVVGQMLDYAANGARYWPAALLQRTFEETCAMDGRPLEDAYRELLGGQSPEEFWVTVEERLGAGRMRLLFVADRIPLELRAIVEFLNRQLRQTDVYAVELTQYRGSGDHRVLVPRVHGEVATANKTQSRPGQAARRWTRADMEAALENRSPEQRQAALALLDHAEAAGRTVGNRAAYPSVSVSFPASGREVPVWTLSLREDPDKDDLAFSFGSITHHLGRDATSAFADALPVVEGLRQKIATQMDKGFTGWPTVPLAALSTQPAALRQVCAAVEQLMGEGSAR
ncbi:hypothetical protein [Streptomyces subrutilus]|uniref:DUF91 domain-containing protein n=1 Tax=Streptomyces subrutilus TaxID=36818 RepID=A0A1E5PXQ5_9ACTN|nr:hypothetical protein [Streptomyces subrutilus]OEJ34152.1 hypothetical protein BGK67_24965 [Streptomyces subrutilus]